MHIGGFSWTAPSWCADTFLMACDARMILAHLWLYEREEISIATSAMYTMTPEPNMNVSRVKDTDWRHQ